MFRTLIVEDSIFYRQLLKETLHFRFPWMDILEAMDGEEALRKVEALPPDLIFVDIKLPGMNGLELTKKIKDQYPNLPIAVLTAYDLPEYREAAKQNKADYFLSKGSATKKSILTMVESILSLSDQRHDQNRPKNGDSSLE